jgi:nucleoid-associated protein YgaU
MEKPTGDEEKTVVTAGEREREEEAPRQAEEKLRSHTTVYIVKKGDHLWAIAGMEQIYDAPRLWPLIFDANRDKIRNPDLIYPEQELTIPREMTDEHMQERLFELWSELR